MSDSGSAGDAATDADDGGTGVVAQLSVPTLSSTPLDVVGYGQTMSTVLPAGGGLPKTTIGPLSVTLAASPVIEQLVTAMLSGTVLATVQLTVLAPGGGMSPLVVTLTDASVTSQTSTAAPQLLQSFTFTGRAIGLKTSAATLQYDIGTASAPSCTGSCCPSGSTGLGPYVVAQPGWSIEPNATRMDSLDDSITVQAPGGSSGGGLPKPTLSPITTGGPLDPTLPCAAARTFTGTLAPVTFAVASPLSASLGVLETETLQACVQTTVSGLSFSASGGAPQESIVFQPQAYVVTERAFDASGHVTSQQTAGWSTLTGSAIQTCP